MLRGPRLRAARRLGALVTGRGHRSAVSLMTEARDRADPPTSMEARLAAATVGDVRALRGPVVLVDYDPSWPVVFQREAQRLESTLGDRARRIEHVGSTSVPGLAAKAIIDIALAVARSDDEAAYLADLEAGGYGLRIREPDWYEHRMLKGPAANINLHVFTDGCPEIERMVRFRDILRPRDEERELYARVKRALALQTWEYLQGYADAKSEVVEEILARHRCA